jgi:hypothetical protein
LLVTETKSYSLFTLIGGKKQNEFSNPASTKLSTIISAKLSLCLGNVLTVISDKRLNTCGSINHLTRVVVSIFIKVVEVQMI